MAHTYKHRSKLSEVLRKVRPYRRPSRKQMLKEFEDEYRARNNRRIMEL